MASKTIICMCCDSRPQVLSPRGWCETCEKEYEAVKRQAAMIPCKSAGKCETPYSCIIGKACVHVVKLTPAVHGER